MIEQDFIKSFASQFDVTDPSEIVGTTDFKNLSEWDSLIALSIIAIADEECGVMLTGDDINKAKTVSDLYKRVIELKNNS